MKKNLKIPFKHRIALIILLFTLLPCIFGGIVFLKYTYQNWKVSALETYQTTVNMEALNVSKTLSVLSSKIDYLRSSQAIHSSLNEIHDLPLADVLNTISVLQELVNAVTTDNSALEIRWYPHNSNLNYGSYCYTLDSLAQEFPSGHEDPAFQEILFIEKGKILFQVRNAAREFGNSKNAGERLFLYSQMNNIQNSDCLLEISIPVTQLVENTGSPVSDGLLAIRLKQNDAFLNIMLTSSFTPNTANTLISDYQQSGVLPGYDIVSAPIPNTSEGEVVFILPNAYAQKQLYPKILLLIFVSILLLCTIVSVSYFTSSLLTKRIIHAVNTVKSDLSHILDDTSDSKYIAEDIDQIASCVRKMIQDTKEHCKKLEHYELENLRMELELLQMRFNPHLLYNTLGTVRCYVTNPKGRSSIDSLCHYYQIALNNGHTLIKIKNEIEMIKEYLAIEKFAYTLNNITFEFQIEDQVAHKTIIKHLLQPIVENALNHGLRPLGEEHPGILRITARLENECIYIQIEDNGAGMSPENIAKLLSTPSPNTYGHGYGIYNVQQRIHIYYGRDYGLSFDSAPNKGTTVTLRIPSTPSGEI